MIPAIDTPITLGEYFAIALVILMILPPLLVCISRWIANKIFNRNN